jgi:hypothetical protein
MSYLVNAQIDLDIIESEEDELPNDGADTQD